MVSDIRIREAAGTLDVVQARELFLEYAAWLGADLCFQHFDGELAALPGDYAPPRGRLLLADVDGQAAGCVALRPLSSDPLASGEMKRLWVRPPFRHLRLGRMLVGHVLDAARAIGYGRVVLDTLPQMGAAIALYKSFGFGAIPPYYPNPIPGAVYLALDIGR